MSKIRNGDDYMEIKRDYYLQKLIDRKENHLIKVITGIRRCGKSYLLNHLFRNYLLDSGVSENHIISIALDDDDNSNLLDSKELREYINDNVLDNDLHYILLDEIQLVPNFEGLLNGLLRKENLDIYVTGSNSKFLSSDIITEFRGRGDEIRVYPLSFREFYSNFDGSKEEAWEEYYTYGGLPLVMSYKKDEDKMQYLESQKQNVYLNDVIERNNVQNKEDLEKLIEIIASSVGSLTNPLKLSKTFKSYDKNTLITDKTIYNYLSYFEDAFIIEKSLRYDIKGKKYIDTPYKYYFTDIGIRNAFLNFRQQEENHIMENIIYIELKRRGFKVDVGVVEVRSKDGRRQYEIDFIANKGNNKIYIQSALNIDIREKREQEEKSFMNVNDFFKKIIIVKDNIKRWRDDKGIIIMGIVDFLLDEDSVNY